MFCLTPCLMKTIIDSFNFEICQRGGGKAVNLSGKNVRK